MILLDANVLLYAYNSAAPEHAQAASWLRDAFASEEPIGIPWITAWAFVRLTTSRKIFPQPRSIREAIAIVRMWSQWNNVHMLSPSSRHLEYLEEIMERGQTRGAGTTDAVLAALAREYGATVVSTDRDFARFPDLKWMNPLDDPGHSEA